MTDVQTASVPPIDEASKPEFAITDNAIRRIAEIIHEDGGKDMMLRISVSGGGCSGFQYGFTLDDSQAEDDLVLERNGVAVLIDSVSIEYLRGSQLDFVEDLIGASFQISNPNATARCGCGSSFAM